ALPILLLEAVQCARRTESWPDHRAARHRRRTWTCKVQIARGGSTKQALVDGRTNVPRPGLVPISGEPHHRTPDLLFRETHPGRWPASVFERKRIERT